MKRCGDVILETYILNYCRIRSDVIGRSHQRYQQMEWSIIASPLWRAPVININWYRGREIKHALNEEEDQRISLGARRKKHGIQSLKNKCEIIENGVEQQQQHQKDFEKKPIYICIKYYTYNNINLLLHFCFVYFH